MGTSRLYRIDAYLIAWTLTLGASGIHPRLAADEIDHGAERDCDQCCPGRFGLSRSPSKNATPTIAIKIAGGNGVARTRESVRRHDRYPCARDVNARHRPARK